MGANGNGMSDKQLSEKNMQCVEIYFIHMYRSEKEKAAENSKSKILLRNNQAGERLDK